MADLAAVVADPDTKSRSGQSARVIGYSPSAGAVLTVIVVHREDRPGGWWGATAGRGTPPTNARIGSRTRETEKRHE